MKTRCMSTSSHAFPFRQHTEWGWSCRPETVLVAQETPLHPLLGSRCASDEPFYPGMRRSGGWDKTIARCLLPDQSSLAQAWRCPDVCRRCPERIVNPICIAILGDQPQFRWLIRMSAGRYFDNSPHIRHLAAPFNLFYGSP
ncbi:hypothetical protein L209DRAFT_395231 [Thermothelomyces heterothallicus CBS 203.75]